MVLKFEQAVHLEEEALKWGKEDQISKLITLKRQ